MKLNFTLAILCIAFLAGNVNAQVIWGGPGDPNSEFDGGLNDWTVNAVSSVVADSTANALWIWSADGTGSDGAYWGERVAIPSPTAANGAAIFNSDFYDNNGVQGDFGLGLAPSPQTSELISPVIDCSGETSVALKFFQYFRNFDATTSVEVSGDGGATFTEYTIAVNDDVPTNGESSVDSILINISATAAGQDSVVLKFKWSGDYYFWIIDDVSLIQLPSNNLTLVDNNVSPFYTPHSAVQPACAIANDPFSFSALAGNSGSDTIFDMTYKIEIINNDTDEFIYSDSLVTAEWAPGIQDSAIAIVDQWLPEDMEVGIYRITHSIFNPSNLADSDASDNEAVQFFEVSDMTFAKEITGAGNVGTWPDGGFYAIGAFYQLGPDCVDNFTISSIEYAVGQVAADEEPLAGRPVEFWLWELTDDFANFDTEGSYEENVASATHPSMDLVAFSIDEIAEEDVELDIISSDAPFLNADGDETDPILKPGETYALFTHWGTGGSTSPLHLFSQTFNTTTDLFYSGGWFGGFTGTKSAPVLRMQLGLFSSVDDLALADEEFKVYPNPASDRINLEINLKEASKATVSISNINGQIITYQNLGNATRDILTINVSNYVAGTYLARIATENGTKTHKFIVSK